MVNYKDIVFSTNGKKDIEITINNSKDDFNTDIYNTGFFNNLVNYLKLKMLVYENKFNEYRLLYNLYEKYDNSLES